MAAEADRVADWNYPLCGCFGDCRTCLLAYFIPCLIVGENAEYVGEDKWTCCCLACASLFFFPAGYLIIGTIIRGKIREQRAIQGSGLRDCLSVYFCRLCTLVQEKRELCTPLDQDILRQ